MKAIPPMTRGVSSGTQVQSRTSSTLSRALMALRVKMVRPVKTVLPVLMVLPVCKDLRVLPVLMVLPVKTVLPVRMVRTVSMVKTVKTALMASTEPPELMVRAYPLVVRLVRCLPRSTVLTSTPSGWSSLVAAVVVSPKLLLMVPSMHGKVQAGLL